MKKLLLSLMTLATGTAFGQITVTSSDVGGTGTQFTYIHDNTSTNLSVGASGANQTWDFTGLSIDDLDDLELVPPNTTFNGALYPNANLALELEDDTTFYIIGNNDLIIDGISGDVLQFGVDVSANYNDDQVIMQFPSDFNDTYLDSASLDTIVLDDFSPISQTTDSGRIKRIVETNSVIDSWGTIETPSGTFDVLRQYLEITVTDSVWLRIMGQSQFNFFIANVSNQYIYRWWANGEDWPVMEMITDAPNGNVIENSFKLGGLMVATLTNTQDASCYEGCDGELTVEGVSGSGSYTYLWDANANDQTTATATGLCAGTYSVTISDGITDQVVDGTVGEPDSIEIEGPPGLPVSTGFDGQIPITVSGGVPPYTYSWTGPNGFTSNDASLMGLEPGDYTLTVTDDNGCTETFEVEVLVSGINDPVLASRINAFPNPTTGALQLVTDGLRVDQALLVDLSGRPVLQWAQPQGTLDLSAVAEGVYLLQLTVEDKTAVLRVQVAR